MLRASIWETMLRICCCRGELVDCLVRFGLVDGFAVWALVALTSDKLTAIVSIVALKVAMRRSELRRRFEIIGSSGGFLAGCRIGVLAVDMAERARGVFRHTRHRFKWRWKLLTRRRNLYLGPRLNLRQVGLAVE